MSRRRLAPLLLVLYVAAVHGLPAVHLLWHRADHVHVLGGLRWLHPLLPAHVHAATHPHEDVEASSLPIPLRNGAPPRLSAAADVSISDLGMHVAAGPAHALSVLLVPMGSISLGPAAAANSLFDSLVVLSGFDFRTNPRARAPPPSI
jgi:hypothetical protein